MGKQQKKRNQKNLVKKGISTRFVMLFIILPFLLFFAVISSLGVRDTVSGFFLNTKQVSISIESSTPVLPSAYSSTVSLGFVGDIMLDRGVRRVVERNGGDYAFVFSRIAPSLRLYDVLFGNLEGAMSNRGVNVGSIYSFRMDPKGALALADAGFDILSVANNHSGDWSLEGMVDTWNHLRGAGMEIVGAGENSAEAYAPVIVERKGVRIAYVAFSEFGKGYMSAGLKTPGIAVISDEAVSSAIYRAKEQSDLVVASFHFGDEYEPEPNAYQKRIARLAIDAGARIVVGHHPHVKQPIERYQDGIIAYSLGNFVFDQPFSVETMEAPVLTVLWRKGKIIDAYIRLAKMDKKFRPGFENE